MNGEREKKKRQERERKKEGHDTGGKEQKYTRIRYNNKEKQKHTSEDLSMAQKRRSSNHSSDSTRANIEMKKRPWPLRVVWWAL